MIQRKNILPSTLSKITDNTASGPPISIGFDRALDPFTSQNFKSRR